MPKSTQLDNKQKYTTLHTGLMTSGPHQQDEDDLCSSQFDKVVPFELESHISSIVIPSLD